MHAPSITSTLRRLWPVLVLIASGLAAFMAWATLQSGLSPLVRGVARAALAAAALAAAVAVVALLLRGRRQHVGLTLDRERDHARAVAGLAGLLAAAFALSIWAIPYPWEWLGTVGVIACLGGALWLGWGLARDGTPARLRQAQHALADGRPDEALASLRALLDEEPDHYPGLVLLAQTQRGAGA
ncbi:MAG: hypothetical protein V1772_02730, partial [Chloroflexota bacterium]